jgi:hypothetical protein
MNNKTISHDNSFVILLRKLLNSNQTKILVGFSLFFLFIILYTFFSNSFDINQKKVAIIFSLLIYFFIALPFGINASRNWLASIMGWEDYTPWKIFFLLLFLIIVMLPFTLFFLNSFSGNRIDNAISPTIAFNPYNTVPDVFKFSIVVVSSTLGGLVLAASNNKNIDLLTKRKFVNASKKFIISTILFILFAVWFFNANIFGLIQPNNFQEHITGPGIYIAVSFWVSVFCYYVGLILFLSGIFELIDALRKLVLSE